MQDDQFPASPSAYQPFTADRHCGKLLTSLSEQYCPVSPDSQTVSTAARDNAASASLRLVTGLEPPRAFYPQPSHAPRNETV
jgi:hypothetical protein